MINIVRIFLSYKTSICIQKYDIYMWHRRKHAVDFYGAFQFGENSFHTEQL